MKYNNLDNPGLKRRILSVTVVKIPDDDPDLSHLGEYSNKPDPRYSIDRKQRGDWERGTFQYFNPSSDYDGSGIDELRQYTDEDYKRMEAYNNGEWYMVGVKAFAKVHQLGGTVIQGMESGGLWGVESDSGEDYFKELAQEQLRELRCELLACGFSDTEISAAFKEVKYS